MRYRRNSRGVSQRSDGKGRKVRTRNVFLRAIDKVRINVRTKSKVRDI